MGINDLFNSRRSSENDNNQTENSGDIAINKNGINNKEDLLSNKEFKQYYIISLSNLINKNVILFGDSKIGKTKLFNLIIGNNETNNNAIGFEININVWDTPGGEQHREANKHFIKDCIISFLCFHFKMKKKF